MVMVSINCITYNHEKYIAQAIEGFLSQRTNFEVEILIHDDASTDRTADIIREYVQKYPEKFNVIYQTENQYSKGVFIGRLNEERARAAYADLEVKADACTDCGECEPRCPYRLPIAAKLRHAHYKLTTEPRL